MIEGKIRKNSYSCKVTVTEVADTSGNTVPQPDAVSGTDNTPNTETPSQPENPEQKPDDTTVQPENPEQKEDGAAEQPEEKPDLERMRTAAAYVLGEHDFKSFCCVRTQAESTVRIIYSLEVLQEGSEIIIRIKGL